MTSSLLPFFEVFGLIITSLPKSNGRLLSSSTLAQSHKNIIIVMLDFITDSLQSYNMGMVDKATTQQLAAVSIAGLVGLYLIISNAFVIVVASVVIGFVCMLYAVPTVTAFSLLAMLITYGFYAFWVFKEWEKAFAGHRLNRRNESCPSNAELPDIKT